METLIPRYSESFTVQEAESGLIVESGTLHSEDLIEDGNQFNEVLSDHDSWDDVDIIEIDNESTGSLYKDEDENQCMENFTDSGIMDIEDWAVFIAEGHDPNTSNHNDGSPSNSSTGNKHLSDEDDFFVKVDSDFDSSDTEGTHDFVTHKQGSYLEDCRSQALKDHTFNCTKGQTYSDTQSDNNCVLKCNCKNETYKDNDNLDMLCDEYSSTDLSNSSDQNDLSELYASPIINTLPDLNSKFVENPHAPLTENPESCIIDNAHASENLNEPGGWTIKHEYLSSPTEFGHGIVDGSSLARGNNYLELPSHVDLSNTGGCCRGMDSPRVELPRVYDHDYCSVAPFDGFGVERGSKTVDEDEFDIGMLPFLLNSHDQSEKEISVLDNREKKSKQSSKKVEKRNQISSMCCAGCDGLMTKIEHRKKCKQKKMAFKKPGPKSKKMQMISQENHMTSPESHMISYIDNDTEQNFQILRDLLKGLKRSKKRPRKLQKDRIRQSTNKVQSLEERTSLKVMLPREISGQFCMECRKEIFSGDHFREFSSCVVCGYKTLCCRAMAEHMIVRHGQLRPKTEDRSFEFSTGFLECCCGVIHVNGNKMASHLDVCEYGQNACSISNLGKLQVREDDDVDILTTERTVFKKDNRYEERIKIIYKDVSKNKQKVLTEHLKNDFSFHNYSLPYWMEPTLMQAKHMKLYKKLQKEIKSSNKHEKQCEDEALTATGPNSSGQSESKSPLIIIAPINNNQTYSQEDNLVVLEYNSSVGVVTEPDYRGQHGRVVSKRSNGQEKTRQIRSQDYVLPYKVSNVNKKSGKPDDSSIKVTSEVKNQKSCGSGSTSHENNLAASYIQKGQKLLHNHLEKKRRKDLKIQFDFLSSLLPINLQKERKSGFAKKDVLEHAKEYIYSSHMELQALEEEKELLLRQQKVLLMSLRLLQEQK